MRAQTPSANEEGKHMLNVSFRAMASASGDTSVAVAALEEEEGVELLLAGVARRRVSEQ